MMLWVSMKGLSDEYSGGGSLTLLSVTSSIAARRRTSHDRIW
jgi:hypothetical protein